MQLTLGSDMAFTVHNNGADPLVFLPQVDWEHFAERTIIDAY